MSLSETVNDNDSKAVIDALRARGDGRIDPVRFRLIEALARRSAGHEGEARRILDDKLDRLLRAYGETVDRHAREAGGLDAIDPASSSTSPATLAGLLERLGPQSSTASSASTETLDYLRDTWSRLSAERSLTQSLATVPENAGPLNSQQLVHRSLMLMRDLSPAYLHRFMTYVDALLRLDQGLGSVAPAGSGNARTEPTKKARKAR